MFVGRNLSMLIKRLLQIIYFFPLFALAQNYTISGHVVDESNMVVAYSNVVLLDSENEPIKGTTTDDSGNFLINNIHEGTYQLKISYLGFEEFNITFELYKNISFSNIVLIEKAEALEGVVVTAKQPTIKRLVDRLVFYVENSTLSNGNILDVLKHAPGIIVKDGEITIKQSTPIVYINDRKVHLPMKSVQELLEGTTATNVKSIEVITNPPAKYEAEGRSVINIVMSKNIVAGYNGSIYGNYKQGFKYPKYSLGTSHFFKTNKLNMYFNYNGNPRKDYRHNQEVVNFKDELNQTVSIWETDFKRTKEGLNHNLNANIDYDLSENDILSFSTNVLIAPEKHSITNVNSTTEIFNANYSLDSLFNTFNNAHLKTNNLAFNLDFVHKFNKEGEKLSVNAHHTNYDFSNLQNVNSLYYLPNENTSFRNHLFQTHSNQKALLYTGQIDYELPIGGNMLFQSGLKYSNIDSESFINQFVLNNGQKTEDINEQDTFYYKEKNYAIYSSFSKDWEQWSIKAGLRVERTDLSGVSAFLEASSNIEYTKFFPSFYLSDQINDNHQIYFSYNKRISRPRYNDLNPFKYFLNDNTYIVGNPALKPQIDDVLTLGYTLKNTYTFEVYYRYEDSPSLQLFQQDNLNNKLRYINTNIDRNISYGLDFMTYTSIVSNWNLYVLSSLFYYEGKYYNDTALITNNKWSVYAQIINYFSFLKDKSLTADLSYNLITPTVDGPSVYSTRHGLDMNLRKSMWSNRASVNIGITDAFNTQNFNLNNNYADQDLFMQSRMENRMFTFGFNYKFGNYKLKVNKKEIDLEERNRLENNNAHN